MRTLPFLTKVFQLRAFDKLMNPFVKNGLLLCWVMSILVGCQSTSPPALPANVANSGKKMSAQTPVISPTIVARSATLSGDITMALYREPKLKGCVIGVSVSNVNGTVTLLGTIAQASQEKTAIQIAEELTKKRQQKPQIISSLKVEVPQKGAQTQKMTKPVESARQSGAEGRKKLP